MDSDSDTTVIMDSEEDPLDTEEVLNEQTLNIPRNSLAPIRDNMLANSNSANDTNEINNANLNIIGPSVETVSIVPSIGNFRQEHPLIHSTNQETEASENVQNMPEAAEGVVEIDNDEARSPSLLTVDPDRNQAESRVESPTKEKACADKNQQSPKKRPRLDSDTDDDGATCPICLDNWTNLGDHRICALKCGHLFGLSCILRWFSTERKKNCPTCKKKAVKNDIRYIYAKKLIAMDASELENVKKQLTVITEEKNRIQIELTRAVCREHLIMQQVEDLKRKVRYLDTALEFKQRFCQTQTNSESSTSDTIRLYMDKSLEICKEGGCRVLDYFRNNDLIVASMKSPNHLFRGFGVRKIDVPTYRPTAFIPLHTLSIRDVCFHPENPWLLSVSLDRTIKVVDTQTNLPVAVYSNGDVPLWSCTWDVNDTNMFYVGKQSGSVAKFDMRHVTEPVSTLEVPGDMSPVVSVACIAVNPGNAIASGGVVICKLNSLWVFENAVNEYTRHLLPVEGPFISMKYQNINGQLLVSTRSNPRIPYSRHHLYSIESGASNNLLCNTIHCFPGGASQKLLSRSCIVSNNANYYVAAHQEVNKSVYLWSVGTGRKVCSLPAHDPVLDLCDVNSDSTNFLVSLTERKMEFFKYA